MLAAQRVLALAALLLAMLYSTDSTEYNSEIVENSENIPPYDTDTFLSYKGTTAFTDCTQHPCQTLTTSSEYTQFKGTNNLALDLSWKFGSSLEVELDASKVPSSRAAHVYLKFYREDGVSFYAYFGELKEDSTTKKVNMEVTPFFQGAVILSAKLQITDGQTINVRSLRVRHRTDDPEVEGCMKSDATFYNAAATLHNEELCNLVQTLDDWSFAQLSQTHQHLGNCGASAPAAPDVYTEWVGTKPTPADIISEMEKRKNTNNC